MKKTILLIFSFLGIWTWTNAQPLGGVEAGVVYVKVTPTMATALQRQTGNAGVLRASSSSQVVQTGVKSFDAAASELKVGEMHRLFPYHSRYEARQQKSGLHLWYVVKMDPSIAPLAAAKRLNADPNVTKAEQVLIPIPFDSPPTNDTYLGLQWHYNNTGQKGGTPGADINLFKAWQKSTGTPNVLVAIIDGGVDVKHEDLKANMWVNTAELNGQTGVDDDGNGYVDDIYGYNFTIDAGNITAHDHGTHVAGTVGATNNNGKGVAGVAGGSGVGDGIRMMSCQIFPATPTTNTAAPFVYAANMGAVIAQCSWGWETPGAYNTPTMEAIDYFIEYAGKDENGNPLPGTPMVGGFVVIASGNNGADAMYYPGCYEKVFAVSALTQYNKKAYYSNYASWVDVSAPGGDTDSRSVDEGVLSTYPNDRYGYMQGTSMACPHVSGVAALVVSKFGSSSFTADALEQRLVASCRNIDDLNAGYIGKLGAGAVDADKALEDNTGQAPAKATISVAMRAQDIIDIAFVAPIDTDNGSAYRYEARYSEQPITTANYASLPIVTKKAKEAGMLDTIRVGGLMPQTRYYIAMRSFDTWANASELSNILEVTTTASAKVKVTPIPDPAILTINVASAATGTANIKIESLEEGAVIYNMASYYSTDPRPLPTADVATLATYLPTITYANSSVGGDGASAPFYAASQIQVTTDDFNMTGIKASFKTAKQNYTAAASNFRIKVIKGGDKTPNEGVVVYDEVSTFKATSATDRLFDLAEQIPFKKGEYIWIVLEFPTEYYSAMGANSSVPEANIWGKNLFSEDFGRTWQDLNKVNDELGLFSPKVAFRMFAVSKQYSLAQDVSFAPTSGSVTQGNSANVAATYNATNMMDGDYITHVKVLNNDLSNRAAWVPVKITVMGHTPKFSAPSEAIFGTVIVGAQAEAEVEIENTGLGVLQITSITSNKPQFTASANTLTVGPRQKSKLKVYFMPTTDANLTAALKFTTNDGEKTIVLQGAGVNPPNIGIVPASLSFTANAGDNVPNQTFTITNTGDYKLAFTMPAAITVENPDLDYKDTKTGYVARTTVATGAPAFSWADMTSATDITRIVEASAGVHTVDLGFTISYYGQEYDKVTLTACGYAMMGEWNRLSNNKSALPQTSGPGKILAPFWKRQSEFFPSKAGGKVLYKKEAGKFILEYNHYGEAAYTQDFMGNIFSVPASGTIDVQMVIFSDGHIEYHYKNFVQAASPANDLLSDIIIGMENETSTDGIFIVGSGRWRKGTTAKFIVPGEQVSMGIYPPMPKLIKSVSPTSGLVAAGESQTVTVELQAPENALDGTYKNYIHISTNVPASDIKHIEVTGTINSISKPTLDAEAIHFGKVAKGYTKELTVSLMNEGGKPFNVTAVSSDNPAFTVTSAYGTSTCGGFASLDYKVTFAPTAAANYTGTLTITTNVSGAAPLTMQLSGEGVLSPKMVVVADASYQRTLNSGEQTTDATDVKITIKNEGEGELEYILGGSQWLKPFASTLGTLSNSDKSGYYWVDNTQDASVVYEWIPTDNAVSQERVYRTGGAIYQLPFKFTFYGKEYSQLVLSGHGQVFFSTESKDNLPNAAEGTPISIPLQDGVDNVICLLRTWMFPYYYDMTERVAAENFDDKVVLTWERLLAGMFADNMAGTRVTAQMILYKDGRIKFQYKDVETAAWRSKSNVGIENADGTDGLEIAFRDGDYIKNGLAIMITPGKKYTLAAGSQVEVPVRVDATGVYDGVYNGNLTVTANLPVYQLVKVPVELTVIGQSSIVVDEAIDYGLTYVYMKNGVQKSYAQPLTIQNIGTKKAVFSAPTLPAGFVISGLTFPLTIQPNTTLQGTVTFTPTSVIGEGRELLHLPYAGDRVGDEEQVELRYTSALPPKASLATNVQNNHYKVKLVPGKTAQHSPIVVENKGDSELVYQMKVEYMSLTDMPSPGSRLATSIVRKEDATLLQTKAVPSQLSAPKQQETTYADALGYLNRQLAGQVYLENPIDLYYGTRLQAGAEGFNLTHVAASYECFNEAVEFEVTILAGKNFQTADSVYSQMLQARVNSTTGRGIEIHKLDKSFYFYAGEYFWILFREKGAKEFLISTFYFSTTAESENFLYIVNGSIYQYTQGWIVGALSETKLNNVPSWITLTPNSGTLSPAAAQNLQLNLASAHLNGDYRSRYARVSVTSNDPLQATDQLLVEMTFNQAPVIAIDNPTIGMVENEQSSATITVSDSDNDAVTLAYTLDASNPTVEAPVVSLTNSGNTYTFAVSAPYNSVGTWVYNLVAKDVNQLSSQATITVVVGVGQRPPAIVYNVENATTTMKENQQKEVLINLTDVDNDAISLELLTSETGANSPIVALRQDGSSYRFTINAPYGSTGTWPYRFKVTDATGLTSESILSVIVTPVSKELNLFPNPATTYINLSSVLTASSTVEIRIFNTVGELVDRQTFTNVTEFDQRIDISRLPAGLYMLQYFVNGKEENVKRFVK